MSDSKPLTPEQEILFDSIKREFLSNFLFIPADKKNIFNAYVKTFKKLENMKLDNKVSDFKCEKPDILWNTWSFKEKATWIYLNYFGFGNKIKSNYYASWDPDLQEYALEKEFWFEDSPKRIMVIDIYFKPVTPAERIQLNFTRIGNETVHTSRI